MIMVRRARDDNRTRSSPTASAAERRFTDRRIAAIIAVRLSAEGCMPTSTKTPAKPAAIPAARKIGAAAAAAPYIGQVDAFAFNFAPAGWMPCDGRLLQIAQYQELFSLLGTTYGGDGIRAFALPKLAPIAPAGPHYFIAVTATAPTRG
jgi:hypothetical protein